MGLKHQKVFTDIQNKILSGYWPENRMIPPELELCEKYKVSRITVRRALDDLVQLGLIHRIRGKGTFVSKAKPYSEYRSGLISQDGIEQNTQILNNILEDVTYPNESELSQTILPIFNQLVEGGQGVTRIRLLRFVDEFPYAIMSIFMPENIGNKIDRELLRNHSFLDAYELSFNEKIVTLHRSITAVIPDDEQCYLLGSKPKTAHVWMKNTATLADESPVAISYALYNGNLFDFAVSINLENPPKLML